MSDKFVIYAVDDSRTQLATYKTLERRLKGKVVVHTELSPVNALRDIPLLNPDLLIVDFEMPDATGKDLLLRLAKSKCTYHSWMISGATGAQDAAREVTRRLVREYKIPVRFFKKPVDLDYLADMVEIEVVAKERGLWSKT